MRHMPQPEPVNCLEILHKVAWLRAAGSVQLAALATQAQAIELQNDDVIARRGQVLDSLLVLGVGRLEMSMTSRNGKRHVVNHLAPGDVFGLIPLVDGGPVIHDAQACGAVVIARLPKESLFDSLKQSHNLTMALMRTLCERSRDSYERIADKSLLSIRARIAKQLLLLSQHRRKTSIEISQVVLAEMVGISRQSLQIELKHLESDGWLQQAYSSITLVDAAALAGLVQTET